jgi:hypothetical protein
MNTGGKIVNVQWDFDFRDGIFSATQGYQLCRKEIQKARAKAQRRKGGEDLGDLASLRESSSGGFEGDMTVEYSFLHVEPGTEVTIACRVQDDLGGEGMKAMKLKVE